MCLYTENLAITVSKEEIPVYKVVRKCPIGYYTPYFGDYYPSLPFTKKEAPEKFRPTKRDTDTGYIIGPGYIHSYLSLEGARQEALSIADFYSDFRETPESVIKNIGGGRGWSLAILKGHIPQSTEYITATNYRNKSVVASKSITLDEEVDCEDLRKFCAERISVCKEKIEEGNKNVSETKN